ncbi:MAG TPA: recombinase family protein [Propionibacteriaceae bacterium]
MAGANRDRPGLRLALAACRAGDTLVVTKLDRLARSVPMPVTSSTPTKRNAKLSLGGSIHDPTDPGGAAAVRSQA